MGRKGKHRKHKKGPLDANTKMEDEDVSSEDGNSEDVSHIDAPAGVSVSTPGSNNNIPPLNVTAASPTSLLTDEANSTSNVTNGDEKEENIIGSKGGPESYQASESLKLSVSVPSDSQLPVPSDPISRSSSVHSDHVESIESENEQNIDQDLGYEEAEASYIRILVESERVLKAVGSTDELMTATTALIDNVNSLLRYASNLSDNKIQDANQSPNDMDDIAQTVRNLVRKMEEASVNVMQTQNPESMESLEEHAKVSAVELVAACGTLFSSMKLSIGLSSSPSFEDVLKARFSPLQKKGHRRVNSELSPVSIFSQLSLSRDVKSAPTSPRPDASTALLPETAANETSPAPSSQDNKPMNANQIKQELSKMVDELSMDNLMGDIEKLSSDNTLLQAANQTLTQRNVKLEGELQRLRRENGLLKTSSSVQTHQMFQSASDSVWSDEKHSMTDTIVELRTELDSMRKQMMALKASSQTWIEEKTQMILKLEHQSGLLANNHFEIEKLQKENKHLQDKLASLTAAANQTQEPKNSEWEKEKKILNSEIELLRLANKRLEISRFEVIQSVGDPAGWEKLQATLGKELRKFFTTLSPSTGLSGILSFLGERLTNAREIEIALKEDSRFKNDIKSLISFLELQISDISPYKETITFVEQSYLKNLDALRHAEHKLQSLELRLEEKDRHVDNLLTEMEDVQKDLRELQEANGILKQEKYTLRLELTQARRAALDATQLLNELKAKIAQGSSLQHTVLESSATQQSTELASPVPKLNQQEQSEQELQQGHKKSNEQNQETVPEVPTIFVSPGSDYDLSKYDESAFTDASIKSPLENRLQKKIPNEDMAATVIQRIFRGVQGRKVAKKILARKHIAQEIFENESGYIKNITILQDLYMNNMKRRIGTGNNAVITKEQFESIFNYVPELLEFNKVLLEKIRSRVEKWSYHQLIGDVFVDISSHLDVYTNYVNNYNKALTALHDCKQNASFRSFMQDLKVQQGRRSLDLADLLIMPIQRTPRYLMLLQSIYNKTLSDHPDYFNLQIAIESLKSTVEIINMKKGEVDRFQKVMELSGKLTGLPAKFEPLMRGQERFFIKDGDMYEQISSGVVKDRRGILFSDIFIVCKAAHSKRDSSINYEYKWGYPLSALREVDGSGTPDLHNKDKDGLNLPLYPILITFQGDRSKEKRILNVTNETDRSAWMAEFEKAQKAWVEYDNVTGMFDTTSVNANSLSREKSRLLTPFGRSSMVGTGAKNRSPPGSVLAKKYGSNDSLGQTSSAQLIQESQARIAVLKKEIITGNNVAHGLQKLAASSSKSTKITITSQMEENKRKLYAMQKELIAEEQRLDDLLKVHRLEEARNAALAAASSVKRESSAEQVSSLSNNNSWSSLSINSASNLSLGSSDSLVSPNQ